MNQVEVLRKVLQDSLVRHEGHVALDRLARLVEADRRVQASLHLSWDGDGLKERNAAVRDAQAALSAVLGEEG